MGDQQSVTYSDVPQGAKLVTPTSYSDLPKGAQIVAHGSGSSMPPSAVAPNASFVQQPQQGLLSKGWDAINKPLVSPEDLNSKNPDPFPQSSQYIAEGRPVMAGVAKFGEGLNTSLKKLASSLTSPIGIGTALATGGVGGTAGRVLGSGTSLLFGGMGAKEALTPRQPGENTPDMLERRLGGAGQAALGVAGEANASKGAVQGVAKEMSGIGPSMVNLKKYLHTSATEKIQPFVKAVDEGAHTEAQANAANLAKTMDAAKPEGYFPKAAIKAMVKANMGDIVKIPGKNPNSIANLLDETTAGEGKGGWGKSTGPTVGGRKFDLSNPSDLAAYQKMKQAGVFTPEEIEKMEGPSGKATDNFTFQQMWQHMSAIGRELGSLRGKGPVEAGANKVYGELQNQMRAAAESVKNPDGTDKGGEWASVRKGWKDYMKFNDMTKDAREGQNASDITKPFLGKNSVPSMEAMNRYARFAPGELGKFAEEVDKHNVGQTVQNISKPRRMDYTIAAISPKLAALKQVVGRGMRSPTAIEGIAGKGLPDIDMAKVAVKKAQSAPPMKTGEGTSAAQMTEAPPKSNPSQEMASKAHDLQRLRDVLANPKANPEERSYAQTVVDGETKQGRAMPFETSTVEKTPSGTTIKTGSVENSKTIRAGEKALIDSGRIKQEDIGRLRRAAMDQWEAQGRPGNLFEDFYAQTLRKYGK